MSHLRQLKKHSTELLTHLGDSPEEVAASLEQAGVHGVPGSNRSCAVALYVGALMGAHPRVRSVAVGQCSLLVNLVTPDLRPGGRLLVQLPKPVRQFVAEFDAGHYPGLNRPPHAVPRPTTEAVG